ncbi:hypothetical protein HCH_06990 [Hahella chejuensis KCTC 2396]|uniref:Uncharacterized protein n=1 Tax=Hahella chejuensis (strain KCTC 2396) TaxID=349521 RepID=Q2S6W8_HAHCH|nr:hypothetical protein HCH_06990 [Hahella chejuensis KCTC 2396]
MKSEPTRRNKLIVTAESVSRLRFLCFWALQYSR